MLEVPWTEYSQEKRSRMVPCQEKNSTRRYSGATQAFLKRNFRRLIFSQKKNLSEVIKNYDLIKSLTKEIPNIINVGSPQLLAKLFSDHWQIKKKLSNEISNNKLNKLFNFLLEKCHFIGGKLIGAGGGGFFLMITEDKKKTIKLLKKNSISYMNFDIDYIGSRTLNSFK